MKVVNVPKNMESVVLSRCKQKTALKLRLSAIYWTVLKRKHAGDSRGTCFQMLTFPVELCSIQDCILIYSREPTRPSLDMVDVLCQDGQMRVSGCGVRSHMLGNVGFRLQQNSRMLQSGFG